MINNVYHQLYSIILNIFLCFCPQQYTVSFLLHMLFVCWIVLFNGNMTVCHFMSYQSDTPGNDNNAGNCKACAYALCVRKREREILEKPHIHCGQTTVPAESRTVTKECDRCNGDALGIKKPSASCCRCLLAPPGLRVDFFFLLLDVIY